MQNQQFISEEERAAYAKIEAPILCPRVLGYWRLDIIDNDRGGHAVTFLDTNILVD